MGLDNNNPIVLTVVTSGASFARSFSIKVTQIECNSLSKGNPDDTMIRGVIDTFVVLDRYLQLLHRKQFNNLSNDKHKTFPMSKGSDANNYHFYLPFPVVVGAVAILNHLLHLLFIFIIVILQ